MPITDKIIAAMPAPDLAETRLQTLSRNATAKRQIRTMDAPLLHDFLHLISYSSFIFYLFCRQPDFIREVGQPAELAADSLPDVADYQALRHYKYRQLLRICWMDISARYDYDIILSLLSRLAVSIIRAAMMLVAGEDKQQIRQSLALFALGKLGAEELNFSSDIDLIFVSTNDDRAPRQHAELLGLLTRFIRAFSQQLEQNTGQGFLYRVDLKLRPWGGSGPLIMSIDETENYYEASSAPWERLAWLRARCVGGNPGLGADLLQRLHPFIFMRSLSTSDLERFLALKSQMAAARIRQGHWHVKTGEGGIRDIEFFIHILQLVNAARHPELQQTNTLMTLAALGRSGYLNESLVARVRQSYLFLRRLENRLQMREEQQTHALPDAPGQRLIIARSLGMSGADDDQVMDNFETLLFANQMIARQAFEQILPEQTLPEQMI